VETVTRFYVAATEGHRARLCVSSDGNEIVCSPLTLPPEATAWGAPSPWVLPGDDGADVLVSFGGSGQAGSTPSLTAGVFRASHGTRVVEPDRYYVMGGFARTDGSARLLLQEGAPHMRGPRGNEFVIARIGKTTSKLQLDTVTLTDKPPGSIVSVAMLGPWVMWVTTRNELMARSAEHANDTPVKVTTLPGPAVLDISGRAFAACRAKVGTFILVRSRLADDHYRAVLLSANDAGLGAPQLVDDGKLFCNDDGASILHWQTVSSCTGGAAGPLTCTTTKIEPPVVRGEALLVLGGTLVRVSARSNVLHIEWHKGGKTVAAKVYDAQMNSTVLLSEGHVREVGLIGRRDYGLLFVEIGGTQHVARIDASGGISPVAVRL
jgi:hypothetical protein